MASRRSLKKTVNYITELAAGLCLVESANANAEKREAYSEVFPQIINLRNDIISRISHTEPGSVKLFYKKLRADFNAEVDNVFKKLGRTVEITHMKQAICRFIYHKLLGWKAEVNVPDFKKCIICAAPHTTNSGLVYRKIVYHSHRA